MKSLKQTEFWKLPILVKFVVIWFFVLALKKFWQVGCFLIARFSLDLISSISGIIAWSLAIGLINRSNGSRKWAAFFVFLDCLYWSTLLIIAVFKDPGSVEGLNINYDRYTRVQMISFFVTYLALDAGILFALLRSKSRAFFLPENGQLSLP